VSRRHIQPVDLLLCVAVLCGDFQDHMVVNKKMILTAEGVLVCVVTKTVH